MALRDELLLKMYDQMLNDINRHITVTWQSIATVLGTLSILGLSQQEFMPIDFSITLILVVCTWLLSHLLDAGYWYNRNLAIIANIEKQYLKKKDLQEIHYYFGKHRPNNKMLTHLKIQFHLGLTIALLFIFYHFFTRVSPGFSESFTEFDYIRAIPYFFICFAYFYLCRLNKNKNESYQEFLKNSPGKDIDVSDIDYGIGHGHNN